MRTGLLIILCLLQLKTICQSSFNMNLLANVDYPNAPESQGAKYNDCWGYRHTNGTEIAIFGGAQQIFFVDVTDPENPETILSHQVLNLSNGSVNTSLWRDFKTYQNYAYACSDASGGTSGLLIFDLSQLPDTVILVNQTNAFFNRSHTIFIDEEHGRLYACGTNTQNNGLVVLDLTTDPTNPALIANVPLNTVGGGYVHAMYVRDHIAYCSHIYLAKLQVYDFSNLPTSFDVIGSITDYPGAGLNHSSWLNDAGDYLVMADETHGSPVKLIDVSDIENVTAEDCYTFYSELEGPGAPGSSIAHNPYILGNLAIISYYHDGVQVFDISDPENIVPYAHYDTYPNSEYSGYKGCWGVYPFLPSGTIVASDMTYGLFLLQIQDQTLDIAFLNFDASRHTDGDVFTRWIVADAAFGNTFEIMRSEDNGITFTAVGRVHLKEGQSQYSWIDKTASPDIRYTYRVDFLQHDGKRVSSPMRTVRSMENLVTASVVNPMSDWLRIMLQEEKPTLDLRLYNMDGRLVWTKKVENPGLVLEYSTVGFPAGQYVLTIQWPGGIENLLVQKH